MHDPTTDTLPRALATVLLVGVSVLLLASVANGAWDAARAPFPFVWRDVAFVYLVASIPFAWVLAVRIRSYASAIGAVVIAGLVGAGSLIPSLGVAEQDSLLLIGAPILRAVSALGLGLAVTLLVRPSLSWRSGSDQAARGEMALLALTLSGALLLPAIYVNARTRHDAARLSALWNQSRYAEALSEARALLALDPDRSWNGHKLHAAAAALERNVRGLEAMIQTRLPAEGSSPERLERARHLAMLGRTQAALDVLAAAETAPAATLRGTIHEAREDWPSAADSFANALAAWEPTAPSEAKTAGVSSALAGLAYAQRKAGRYADAERTYQKLLTHAPTADVHFLLAQFYEDAQHAEKSRSHARQAIALAPERYQQRGDQLLRKLSVYQFGCLGVFSGELAVR